jgi:hypothetical protein
MSVTLPATGASVATTTVDGAEVQIVEVTEAEQTNALLRAILDRLGFLDPALGAQRTTVVNTPAVTLASTTITGTPAVSLASTTITSVGGLFANADQYAAMNALAAQLRNRIVIS